MDGRIFHVKNLLSQSMGHSWTVKEMAEKVGLSVPHFLKLFKTEIGDPPMAYLHQLRLETARYLLESSFLQVKQIGVQTGLTNASHFTRDFKKKFGLSPSE